MKQPSYGIVGGGRMATHMARYLKLESQTYSTWRRSMDCTPVNSLGDVPVILLAISDDALEPFLAEQPELAARTIVHFSGSRVVQGATGLHPLMTFGPEPYDLETYRSIPFVTEDDGASFKDIFPNLSNPSWAIAPENKPLYHALCVMAGNFPTLLWSKVTGEFEDRLGLPGDILRPYLARTLENTLQNGNGALTGPLARGDRGTVQRNLAALGDDTYTDIYRAFARSLGMQEI